MDTAVRGQVPEKDEKVGPTGRGLLGHTIGDLGVRSETGASILAVVRGDEVIPNPGADLALQAGDAVGVLGTPQQRAAFRTIAGANADDSPKSPGKRPTADHRPNLPTPETTPDQWRIPVEFLHIIQPNGTRLCASCSVQHKKG